MSFVEDARMAQLKGQGLMLFFPEKCYALRAGERPKI